jgi:hypothetical protein
MKATEVKKASKGVGNCGSCAALIEKGDSYRWIKKDGEKHVRCASCQFQQSELESDPLVAKVFDTVERTQQSLQSLVSDVSEPLDEDLRDEVAIALEEFSGAIREVTSQYDKIVVALTADCDGAAGWPQAAIDADALAEKLEVWADDCEGETFESVQAAMDFIATNCPLQICRGE